MGIRERRIENEWRDLEEMIAENAGRLWREGQDRVRMRTPFYRMDGTVGEELEVRFAFPEYYPAVPLEAYVTPVVLHPNVHSKSGFVCLWTRRQGGTSLLEAVLQVQRVVSWELRNDEADHVMQPRLEQRVALAYEVLEIPVALLRARQYAEAVGTRRRLSDADGAES